MVEGYAHRPGEAVTEEQGGTAKRAGKLYSSPPLPESTIITTIMTTRIFNRVQLFGASHIQTVQGIPTFKLSKAKTWEWTKI